jgi:hypothetical protein
LTLESTLLREGRKRERGISIQNLGVELLKAQRGNERETEKRK